MVVPYWVKHGGENRYVLSEDEVIERSWPRPLEFGTAAPGFQLVQHLHRAGFRATQSETSRSGTAEPTKTGTTAEALSRLIRVG